jgi:hypothetical protein
VLWTDTFMAAARTYTSGGVAKAACCRIDRSRGRTAFDNRKDISREKGATAGEDLSFPWLFLRCKEKSQEGKKQICIVTVCL